MTASVSAGASTPAGDYFINLSPAAGTTDTTNPTGSTIDKAKLEDKTANPQIKVVVTEAPTTPTDTTAPDPPTLDLATTSDSKPTGAAASYESDDVTNDNTPTFEGTAEAGSTVKLSTWTEPRLLKPLRQTPTVIGA